MRSTLLIAVSPLILCCCAATASAAEPAVDFELLTEPGFPLGGERNWIEALRKLDVGGVRIRQKRPGEVRGVQKRGTDRSPRYVVTGMLTAKNKLLLPAGTFTLNDRARIRAWLDKLRAGGEDELYAQRGAFGLTAKELVDFHQKLATAVARDTKNRPAGDVVGNIADALTVEVEIDTAARRALAGTVAPDELKGISSGTALAAVLRPAGLTVTVDKPLGRSPRLVITTPREAKETWPVGWPVEGSVQKAMPNMFKFLNIEIEDIPLSDALGALQSRLEAPLLFDHNALARHRIDPAEVAVSLPRRRTYYKAAIDKLLFQARLKGEVRLDEAERPFVWITTLKD